MRLAKHELRLRWGLTIGARCSLRSLGLPPGQPALVSAGPPALLTRVFVMSLIAGSSSEDPVGSHLGNL